MGATQWEGNIFNLKDRERYEEYITVKRMEKELLNSNWGIDPYGKSVKKKKPKKKEVKVIEIKDFIIDQSYLSLGNDDGEGDGDSGESQESDMTGEGGGQENGQQNENFDFDKSQDLAEAVSSDEEGKSMEDTGESVLEKLLDMDSIRMNIKRKFRF